MVKEVRATYSIRPQLDLLRPSSASPWPRVFLAGDWIATGWPATMEGAVRSGYLAAEAVSSTAEEPARFLQSDLAADRTDASATVARHGKIRLEKNDTAVSLLTAISRDRTTLTSPTLKNRAWRQIGPAADWFRELCW